MCACVHVYYRKTTLASFAPIVADARRRYLAAHRADDSATRVLQRLRDEGWARRFVREALFPGDAG